jgi:hypothetical protein
MKILPIFLVAIFVTACAPQRTPANQLTFEQQADVFKECEATGKSSTDPYCKEVGYVYLKEVSKRERESALTKQTQARPVVKMPY